GDTLTATDAANATTTYTYNALGQRVTATDALGNTTWSYYDADGHRLYTIQGQPSGSTPNAQGNVTEYTYNAFGQVASARTYASSLTLTTSGNSSGTILNTATATTSQVVAAVAALPLMAADGNGLTTYSYTLDGQVANQTDGLGYQTAYAYDAFGDRTQMQLQLSAPGSALSAANSAITQYTYSARGERTSETDAAGRPVTRTTYATFDAYGRVTSTTDGNGNVTNYGYDPLGREVSISQVVGGVTRTTQTTYDAFGHVLTQIDALNN